jgi:hypothetical protein
MANTQDRRTNFAASLIIADLATYGGSVVVQRPAESSFGASVVVQGRDFFRRGLTNEVAITERLPNVYYGLTEVDDVVLNYDNLRGQLNVLQTEEARGAPVRIRRYDERSGEVLEVYQGVLSDVNVGDEVQTTVLPHALDILDQTLPKNTITTTEFPQSVDTGAQIPIVMGRAPRVSCPYVREDTLNEVYDYLVCEGIAAIESVQRDGVPTLTAAGVIGSLLSRFDGRVYLALDAGDTAPRGTYTRLFLTFTSGEHKGSGFEILDHGPFDVITGPYGSGAQHSNVVQLAQADMDTLPALWMHHDTYTITEYRVLPGTAYAGRTALRFRYRQVSGGQLQRITADVARYRAPRKNRLRASEDFLDAHWIRTNVVPKNDAGDIAPDFVTPAWRGAFAGPTSTIRQTVPIAGGVGLNDFWTFSLFAKGASTTGQAVLTISSNGVGQVPLSATLVGGYYGERIAFTKSGNWGTGATEITVEISTASAKTLVFANAQLEMGNPTYYEPVDADGRAFLWSFPDAISEILSNSRWGLGQLVDAPSFEAANAALSVGHYGGVLNGDLMTLRCQGSLPDVFGEGGTAKDVLDELLMIRSLRLGISGSAWRLSADMPGAPAAGIFGTEETPYDNIASIGLVNRRGGADAVKSLKVLYQPEVVQRTTDLIPVFAYEVTLAVSLAGTEKVLPLRWVRDHSTAAHQLQHLTYRLRLAERSLPIDVGHDGRALRAGDIITLVAPRHQPENLLFDDAAPLGGTAWSGTDPARRTNGAVAFDFPATPSHEVEAGQTLFNQYVTPFSAAAGHRVIATIWLRAAVATSDFVLRVGSYDPFGSGPDAPYSEVENVPVQIGTHWRQYRVEHTFGRGTAGDTTFAIVLPVGKAAQRLYYANAQVVYEYDKAYVRSAGFWGIDGAQGWSTPPLARWQVQECRRTNVNSLSLVLYPHDDVMFVFNHDGDWPALRAEAVVEEPANPTPELATGLTLPPAPPANTAAAGVDSVTQGSVTTSTSWAEISFLMPTRNAVGVRVQLRKQSEIAWADIGTVVAAEAAPGTRAAVMARGLVSGQKYEVRVVSFTPSGLVNGLDTFGTFTAR